MNSNLVSSDHEIKAAYRLIRRVFAAFVAPDYSAEGVASFLRLVTPEFMASLSGRNGFIINTSENGDVVGTIAVRDTSHIALFFVDESYQGKGIGKALFFRAARISREKGAAVMTVHSSPYAKIIYEALGFRAVDSEKVEMGIRYIPMEADIVESFGEEVFS